ncbi:NgoPII family restriction endonuclease [Prevotella veroralis]
MGNILTAITAIVGNSLELSGNALGEIQNRVNQMGAALEDYVKNAFADCIGKDQRTINSLRNSTFSYLGNNTNPPDAMLKGSDAIEIKKVESAKNILQFNSSYPKNKLSSGNPKISVKCKNCEEWNTKDMIYVVGHVEKSILHNIFFVYGDVYCDAHNVYENVENTIKECVQSLDGIESSETRELGRVNKVDYLGISSLRVRGMWVIASPFKQFEYLYEDKAKEEGYSFRLIAIIPVDKYDTFKNKSDFETFCMDHAVVVNDEDIPDPQNPAEMIKCKVVIYKVQ